MPTEYAHALSHSLAKVTEKKEATERVDALVETLEQAGKLKALPAILREYERIEAKKTSVNPTITVAREEDGDGALKELMDMVDAVPKNISVDVEDNIIGGWRFSDKDTLIDNSHKAALLKLYKSVTSQ